MMTRLIAALFLVAQTASYANAGYNLIMTRLQSNCCLQDLSVSTAVTTDIDSCIAGTSDSDGPDIDNDYLYVDADSTDTIGDAEAHGTTQVELYTLTPVNTTDGAPEVASIFTGTASYVPSMDYPNYNELSLTGYANSIVNFQVGNGPDPCNPPTGHVIGNIHMKVAGANNLQFTDGDTITVSVGQGSMNAVFNSGVWNITQTTATTVCCPLTWTAETFDELFHFEDEQVSPGNIVTITTLINVNWDHQNEHAETTFTIEASGWFDVWVN